MKPFTEAHLGALRKQMSGVKAVDPTGETYGRLVSLLDGLSLAHLRQLASADIKFLSLLALNRVRRATK